MSKIITTTTGSFSEDDLKFYKANPSKNFSPARNKAIVAQTIRETIEARKKKMSDWQKDLHYRTDALATYFHSLAQGKEMTPEKYFGRRELAKLHARHVMQTVFTAENGQKGLQLGWSEKPIVD
jgi:hypothetical protein